MIRIHPSLREFAAVITKKRSGGPWFAAVEKLVHRACADGESEQEAVDNLARWVDANSAEVRRAAKLLGGLRDE